MNKLITLLLLLTLSSLVSGQTTADFEDMGLMPDSYLDGGNLIGDFESGNIGLINNFNPNYNSWTGWAISSTTDTSTPGYMNQYSSISGSGHKESDTYAVAYVVGESLLYTRDKAKGGVCKGFYINNSTYAYLSMLNGDGFAKKFGGEDGTDPDYFLLTIKEYGSRRVNNDSINVYLADYRFDDSTDDYIINEWTYVPLDIFENVDTLSFTLSSTDNGNYGMNTPAYFCIDDFVTEDKALTSIPELSAIDVTIYPNPTSELLIVSSNTPITQWQLIDVHGRVILNENVDGVRMEENIENLISGIYYVRLEFDNSTSLTKQVIKL